MCVVLWNKEFTACMVLRLELCNTDSIFSVNSPYDFSYELRLVLTESQWLNESNSSDCSQQQWVLQFWLFFTEAMSSAVLTLFHRSNEFCSSGFVSQKQWALQSWLFFPEAMSSAFMIFHKKVRVPVLQISDNSLEGGGPSGSNERREDKFCLVLASFSLICLKLHRTFRKTKKIMWIS